MLTTAQGTGSISQTLIRLFRTVSVKENEKNRSFWCLPGSFPFTVRSFASKVEDDVELRGICVMMVDQDVPTRRHNQRRT
jgi:hypothetical protein